MLSEQVAQTPKMRHDAVDRIAMPLLGAFYDANNLTRFTELDRWKWNTYLCKK